MLLCIVYGIFFVDTVNTEIKAYNALNAVFVETVDTLYWCLWLLHNTVYRLLWGVKTLLYSTLCKVASHPSKGEGYSTVPSVLWV